MLAPGVSFAGSKIDKFMTEDGTMMEGWVVNLNGGVLRRAGDVMVVDGDTTPGLRLTMTGKTRLHNDAIDAAEMAGMFDGTTNGTGGALEWSGRWDASFHGTNRATLPTGAVGTFQAHSKNACPPASDYYSRRRCHQSADRPRLRRRRRLVWRQEEISTTPSHRGQPFRPPDETPGGPVFTTLGRHPTPNTHHARRGPAPQRSARFFMSGNTP